MASPRGPSENTGLRVSPGLLNAFNGPRGGLWRVVAACVIAVFLSPFGAHLLAFGLAPGSAFFAGQVCPDGHALAELPIQDILPESVRRQGDTRQRWLACRTDDGQVLQSRAPHDKLLNMLALFWIAAAVLPIRLLLARLLRNAVPLDPRIDDEARIGGPPGRPKKRRKPGR